MLKRSVDIHTCARLITIQTNCGIINEKVKIEEVVCIK